MKTYYGDTVIMSSTDLEILNLKRQVEKQNIILEAMLEEIKRFNDNYERLHKYDGELAYGIQGEEM